MSMNRRRFLAISAAAAGMAAHPAGARTGMVWTGVALGARASIRLDHPDAAAIAARAAAEIARLEAVFSLYRADSALSRLNAGAGLDLPPPELLQCLSLAAAVHRASDRLFDPTVQPLWALWAERVSAGGRPSPAELAATRQLGLWSDVRLDAARISLNPGMALTLNGIAQGFIADRVADLLAAEGLTDILIDTGEHRALGGQPGGGDWPVTLASGGEQPLRDLALATSAPLGTVFDAAGKLGHILDPMTGEPASLRWSSITMTARSAALADALSTAACLAQDQAAIDRMLAQFEGAACVKAAAA